MQKILKSILTKIFPAYRRKLMLEKITRYYLNSGDFNGTPVGQYSEKIDDIRKLILDRKLDLVRGDGHPNPHIKAHKPPKSSIQIQKLMDEGVGRGCLYPTPEHLKKLVREEDYRNSPFQYDLACGQPSLEHVSFDVRILEYFRNDPRFSYRISDSHGSIYARDDSEVVSGSMDDILLNRFGFGFKKDQSRIVAVMLWDLLKLDSAQQMQWKPYQTHDEAKLHPDFFRSSLLGKFPETISLYRAIVSEMGFINELCDELGFKSIFKNTFEEDYPREFHFLIRPTLKEFHSFVLLLDKMLSENIDPKILSKQERKIHTVNSKGETIITQKGSIAILQEWLAKQYNFTYPEAPGEILESFRKVRKIRQKPAHEINKDIHDNIYFKQQIDLIEDVFSSLNTIRKILSMHPKISQFKLPDWYKEEKIIVCPYPKD